MIDKNQKYFNIIKSPNKEKTNLDKEPEKNETKSRLLLDAEIISSLKCYPGNNNQLSIELEKKTNNENNNTNKNQNYNIIESKPKSLINFPAQKSIFTANNIKNVNIQKNNKNISSNNFSFYSGINNDSLFLNNKYNNKNEPSRFYFPIKPYEIRNDSRLFFMQIQYLSFLSFLSKRQLNKTFYNNSYISSIKTSQSSFPGPNYLLNCNDGDGFINKKNSLNMDGNNISQLNYQLKLKRPQLLTKNEFLQKKRFNERKEEEREIPKINDPKKNKNKISMFTISNEDKAISYFNNVSKEFHCTHPKCEFSSDTSKQLQYHHDKMIPECRNDSIQILKLIYRSKIILNGLLNKISDNNKKKKYFSRLYKRTIDSISLNYYYKTINL